MAYDESDDLDQTAGSTAAYLDRTVSLGTASHLVGSVERLNRLLELGAVKLAPREKLHGRWFQRVALRSLEPFCDVASAKVDLAAELYRLRCQQQNACTARRKSSTVS